jgi:Domain of unknown function (DUF6378)
MTILEEAAKLTSEDRHQDYGDPDIENQKIAVGWGVIFMEGITADKIPLAMIWLKTVRELNKHKRDNLVDIAGYARTREMMDEDNND